MVIIMNTTLEKNDNDSALGFVDTWRLYFSLSSFVRKKEIEICGSIISFTFILGKHKFYGYMAEIRDMENFNKLSHEKSRLKFEMMLYKEIVWN
ncbi:hypothetical protein H5410_062501 [Solanum commersonii]|uniref:Uncharacterized protein n=1 Tax=Solanum commersonii TaxID=4109 RepID=A0A9J5WBP4_SOLCO|nr:hypothetical protein H5410_062501 [Solanum commersonii]